MRIVFNTTFHLDDVLEASWLRAVSRELIPRLKQSAGCEDLLFTRVNVAEEAGKTYSLQLIFSGETPFKAFLHEQSGEIPGFLEKHFSGRILHFCSTLEEIDYRHAE